MIMVDMAQSEHAIVAKFDFSELGNVSQISGMVRQTTKGFAFGTNKLYVGMVFIQYLQVFDSELGNVGSLDLDTLQGTSVCVPRSTWFLYYSGGKVDMTKCTDMDQ